MADYPKTLLISLSCPECCAPLNLDLVKILKCAVIKLEPIISCAECGCTSKSCYMKDLIPLLFSNVEGV